MRYVSLDKIKDILILSLIFLTTVAWGQEAGREVSASSRSDLLRQIEIATEALLARFNEINTNRDLDTECRERRVTGSKLERQECKPRFLERAEAERGRQTLQGLQGPQKFCDKCILALPNRFVRPGFSLELDSFEVADAFEVPLDFFMDRANHARGSHLRDGVLRHYHVFHYGERRIWGATAAMLMNLYRRVQGVSG